jgi:hypothetical protein
MTSRLVQQLSLPEPPKPQLVIPDPPGAQLGGFEHAPPMQKGVLPLHVVPLCH